MVKGGGGLRAKPGSGEWSFLRDVGDGVVAMAPAPNVEVGLATYVPIGPPEGKSRLKHKP